MMIFREHLVLGTYARSFVFAIYFFLQCFISVLYKEGNILKARFTFHFLIFIIIRATSHPIPRPSISGRSRVLSPPVTSAGFGKRPAPGFSFIKSKKKKQMNLVKDFTFSSLDEEGQMVMLFPISINLTELLERFGQLSVSIVCSAVEQELRDQGEVVRLVVLDARGQPIMDSSHTRSNLLYSVYSFFVLRSYQVFVFRKKKGNEKYMWYSREVHVEMLSSKLLVLLYFFHLYGFIHLSHRFAMELLSRKHCFLEESNEESNLSQKTFCFIVARVGQ